MMLRGLFIPKSLTNKNVERMDVMHTNIFVLTIYLLYMYCSQLIFLKLQKMYVCMYVKLL